MPGSTEFQSFPTRAAGVAAQERLLHRYVRGGHNTIRRVVERYAPRIRNGGDNTDEQVDNYIAYVARRRGVSPDDALTAGDVGGLAAAMREFETGERR